MHKANSQYIPQAKEFLDKALYGEEEEEGEHAQVSRTATLRSSTSESPPGSPFVKKVENILQYVPSPPAAMQEYVTNLTKNVVENIKVCKDVEAIFVLC